MHLVTFQKAMHVMLSSAKCKTTVVYLDDILMFFRTIEDHVVHVAKVLTILNNAEWTLKLRNCAFYAEKIDCLVHVIRPGLPEISDAAASAIQELKDQTTQT